MDYVNLEFTAQCKLDDANAALDDPPEGADIAELLAARDVAAQELKVARARKAKAQDEAYRTKLQERQAQFRRDLEADLGPLRELLPRLRYHLAGLQQLEARLEEAGESWESLTSGLPFGVAQRLSQAIAREVRGSDTWEEVFAPDAVARLLDAGRAFAKRQAEQRAAQAAERQAAFDEALAAFERGEGPDPRVVTYRIPVGG
jgi:hypothetical protein